VDLRHSQVEWRRSTRCSTGACVEVAIAPSTVGVRDSKEADSSVLTYDRPAWRDFIAGIVAGEFTAR
jgi:hypothetical protein